MEKYPFLLVVSHFFFSLRYWIQKRTWAIPFISFFFPTSASVLSYSFSALASSFFLFVLSSFSSLSVSHFFSKTPALEFSSLPKQGSTSTSLNFGLLLLDCWRFLLLLFLLTGSSSSFVLAPSFVGDVLLSTHRTEVLLRIIGASWFCSFPIMSSSTWVVAELQLVLSFAPWAFLFWFNLVSGRNRATVAIRLLSSFVSLPLANHHTSNFFFFSS